MINFLTELKVRGNLFLERKPVLCYCCISYFAHFQGARGLGKSVLWGISCSSQARQPRCSSACGRLCLWPGGHVAEGTRCFCSMRTDTLCPATQPCEANPSCVMQRAAGAAAVQQCGASPSPSSSRLHFLARAAFCLCKSLVPQGCLSHGPHRSLGCRWVKVAEQRASLF